MATAGEADVQLDDQAFDADNHSHEAVDAFTRHVPPAMQERGTRVAPIESDSEWVPGLVKKLRKSYAQAPAQP
ncbi:MAG: hypothetical protein ACXW2Y_05920 [Acidimicrobiia bacterium]